METNPKRSVIAVAVICFAAGLALGWAIFGQDCQNDPRFVSLKSLKKMPVQEVTVPEVDVERKRDVVRTHVVILPRDVNVIQTRVQLQ